MCISRCILGLTQRDAEKLVKKLLGENEIEAVLQRLDRLTQDEALATAAQTLEVVHSLIHNMKVVMNGERSYLAKLKHLIRLFPL